jgi:polyisoprenyl-phosphate glycosyltransferase
MSSSAASVELSIIAPIYNEEQNINHFFERLEGVLEQLDTTYEIVCVNDGSQDNSFKCLLEHHYRNPAIKVINFSRNFGKEAAMAAGLEYAAGAAVIPIDADLQDPPELIGDLMAKWREGYDMVYATRRSRNEEGWLKRVTANLFYSLIGRLSNVPIPPNTGDFRLVDRRVIQALRRMPERTRFMKGLFAWVGFKQTSIVYDRPQRYRGNTKWNYWRLWNYAIDGITSFSFAPLKVWGYVGFFISLLAFLYAAYLFLRTLMFGIDLPGYASLMVTMLFIGGMQLMTLGIMGEYLSRVYEEVKGRPLYFVRDAYGFGPETLPAHERSAPPSLWLMG